MPLDVNQFSVVELAPSDPSGNWYRVERRTQRRGATVIAPQHPSHQCIAVFESAVTKLGIVEKTPLPDSTGVRVHRWVAQAQRGSSVPLL